MIEVFELIFRISSPYRAFKNEDWPVKQELQTQIGRIRQGVGFFAALDQSGGSTPSALERYGIEKTSYSNETEMFSLMQRMRERVISAPSFSGTKILAAILFEKTARASYLGSSVSTFLLKDRGISSFLKIDAGLSTIRDGVQLMNLIPNLASLLELANDQRMAGTKMRSLITSDSQDGIRRIVEQQFTYADTIIAAGLVPILEPEVSTKLGDEVRSRAEEYLAVELESHLRQIPLESQLLLKLTIPVKPDLYRGLALDPRVVRVLALSGGFSRSEATRRLCRNPSMIGSFSRALLQDLRYEMTDEKFNRSLSKAIDEVYLASAH